jgi:hypothetical protein
MRNWGTSRRASGLTRTEVCLLLSAFPDEELMTSTSPEDDQKHQYLEIDDLKVPEFRDKTAGGSAPRPDLRWEQTELTEERMVQLLYLYHAYFLCGALYLTARHLQFHAFPSPRTSCMKLPFS